MSNFQKHMASKVPFGTSAARERAQAVAEIKAQTASALRSFEHERMLMANTLQAELAADRASRSAEVMELLHSASAMSEGFRQEHDNMRCELRNSLLESRQAVGAAVADLFEEFSKERAAFSKSLRRMAKSQGAGLAKDRHERSHVVAALMRSFATAHHHMAKAQWAGLEKGRRDRSQSLAEMLHGFQRSRAHIVRPVMKSVVRLAPAVKVPAMPRNEPVLPVIRKAELPVKPVVKAAPPASKPWPSAPPRGESLKPVAKKLAAKVTPAKVVLAKAKASKLKKKQK